MNLFRSNFILIFFFQQHDNFSLFFSRIFSKPMIDCDIALNSIRSYAIDIYSFEFVNFIIYINLYFSLTF